MSAWQPQRGERVIAVLPDGHEIEGNYDFYSAPIGLLDPATHPVHVVVIGEPDHRETVAVRMVRPLLVSEPTEFGARVVDTNGFHYVRASVSTANDRPWRRREDTTDHSWTSIRRPVTVIDADPTWEAK